MKKNLILLTSLIPLGISTVPFVTSCNPAPKITSDSIEWDYHLHGSYESRVKARKFDQASLKQEQVLNIYLHDLQNNPYIFIDDIMVAFQAVIDEAKGYGYDIDTAKVNLSFGIDDKFASLSYAVKLHIKQNGQSIYFFDGEEELKNIEYTIDYDEEDFGQIGVVVPRWSFLPRAAGICNNSERTELDIWKDYFAAIDKDWSIKGHYKEIDSGEEYESEFDINKNNYIEKTPDHVGDALSTMPLSVIYSKYLSNAKIEADIILDQYDASKQILSHEGTIQLDFAKHYIVKIDMSACDQKLNANRLEMWCNGDFIFSDYVDVMEGYLFVDYNKQQIIHTGQAPSINHTESDVLTDFKVGDQITTDFYFWYRQLNATKEASVAVKLIRS